MTSHDRSRWLPVLVAALTVFFVHALVGFPPAEALPIYAIGGLAKSDIDDARRAGAHGIAAIRAMGTAAQT